MSKQFDKRGGSREQRLAAIAITKALRVAYFSESDIDKVIALFPSTPSHARRKLCDDCGCEADCIEYGCSKTFNAAPQPSTATLAGGPSNEGLRQGEAAASAPSTTPQKPIAWRYRLKDSSLPWKLADSEDDCNPLPQYEREPLYAASATLPNHLEICQAVARGWCSPINAHKEMDEELAFAIAIQVEALMRRPDGGKQT